MCPSVTQFFFEGSILVYTLCFCGLLSPYIWQAGHVYCTHCHSILPYFQRLAIPTACDIRVAAEDAKVGFTMAARGLCNESLSSYLLPRAIGSAAAKELIFTGRVKYLSLYLSLYKREDIPRDLEGENTRTHSQARTHVLTLAFCVCVCG